MSKGKSKDLKGGIAHAYWDFPLKSNISYQLYSLIIKTYFAILLEKIITTGISYKLPCGLGIFSVTKTPARSKNKGLNWKLMREEGVVEQSATVFPYGFIPKIKWVKTRFYKCQLIFNEVWRLRISKSTRKKLYEEAITNNKIVKYY